MDCAISLRSMARLSASRTRLSLVGGVRPSGPSTHHMWMMASSFRMWTGKLSFSSSFTRSRLTSATSASPRRSSAMRVVSSGISLNVTFLYFGALAAELHVLRAHVAAVMELPALAEMERPALVVGRALPLAGQPARLRRLAVGRDADEVVEHQRQVVLHVVALERRVERLGREA